MAEKKDNAVEEIESKITDEENIEPIEMDDDFYYPEIDTLDDEINAHSDKDIKVPDIKLDESLGLGDDIKEPLVFNAPIENEKMVSSSNTSSANNSDFDTLFDNLYNDVAGANKFISNLIEQKKSVTDNAANLEEDRDKLEKEKAEFERYVESQKQSIELAKVQCDEYVRTQKTRIQNEEAQFNADQEAARAELDLNDASIKAASEKLDSEKTQFYVYKELEEKRLEAEKEKIESDRKKLDADIKQFNNEQDVALTKLKSEQEELQNEKNQFEKSKNIDLEKIKNAQLEIVSQREQFEKFKDIEEKKLELESKNLSQSVARFRELVSQFNSGFQQLPEDKR